MEERPKVAENVAYISALNVSWCPICFQFMQNSS